MCHSEIEARLVIFSGLCSMAFKREKRPLLGRYMKASIYSCFLPETSIDSDLPLDTIT